MSVRRYEVVFVLAPQLTEEEVKNQTETFTKVAEEKGAKVLNIDDWGKRRLAFPVKKNKEGIYVILTLEEGQADAVAELERRFRVSDNVIRHLTVRIDEDLKRAEKFAERRKQRKAQRAQAARAAAEEEAESETEEEPAKAAKATSRETPAEEAESSEEASGEKSSEAEEEAAEETKEEKEPEDAKAVEEK